MYLIVPCDQQHYIWLHSCRISLSGLVVRTASLPLISPSHPLLMFSTESEPCRMCTETSTRSTVLLPGRGSDYIWSINTHWLWEAFLSIPFLPLLSPFLVSLPHSCSLTTVWHLVTICQAICLCCHNFLHYIRVCISSPLSIRSFILSRRVYGEVILSFRCSSPLPSWWRKGVNYGTPGAIFPHNSPLCSVIHPHLSGINRHLNQTRVTKRLARGPCLQMGSP